MNNTRVMIIEDDLNIAQLHQRYLERKEGFEVVSIATSVREAELQLDIINPDLILLDVYLPDGTGIDILHKARTDQQACDVILITAARDTVTLQQAMRAGVVDYLLKPVIFHRLDSALEKYHLIKNQLDNATDVNQQLVDSMMTANVSTADNGITRLPKGIDAVTLDKIRQLFVSVECLTADEAGELIGASRTTARRYLEYLITSGEFDTDLRYGNVGRPERSYRKKRHNK